MSAYIDLLEDRARGRRWTVLKVAHDLRGDTGRLFGRHGGPRVNFVSEVIGGGTIVQVMVDEAIKAMRRAAAKDFGWGGGPVEATCHITGDVLTGDDAIGHVCLLKREGYEIDAQPMSQRQEVDP